MSANGVSTYSRTHLQIVATGRLQKMHASAQAQLASGKVEDVAQSLGWRAGKFAAVETRVTSLRSIVDTNTLATARLKTADLAFQGMSTSAGRMRDLLIEAKAGASAPGVVVRQAKEGLADTFVALNSTYAGDWLIAAANAGEQPFPSYFGTPKSAARTAVEQSFSAAFGITPDDPGVANLAAPDVKAWLDGPFASLFESPQWEALFSNAAADVPEQRYAENETIKPGVSGDEPALRKLLMSYVMMADLGADRMSPAAFAEVAGKALELNDAGNSGVTTLRAALGATLSRIEESSESMTRQIDMFSAAAEDMVASDPYGLSVRINTITARLEASYMLTSKLKDLSLVNYL